MHKLQAWKFLVKSGKGEDQRKIQIYYTTIVSFLLTNGHQWNDAFRLSLFLISCYYDTNATDLKQSGHWNQIIRKNATAVI